MITYIVNIVCGLMYVTIVVVNAVPPSNMSKEYTPCKKSDPNFNECLRNKLQNAIPHLANGIPNLDIAKIDPLRITKLELDQSNKGPVNLKLKYHDLDIHNFKHIQITKVHYDTVNNNFNLEMQNPKSIVLDGNYEISGKVLVLPIVGKGKCKINLDVSKIVSNIQFKPVVKNKKSYLEIVTIEIKFTITKFKVKYDNLFNGDKALGDNMNVFLNENWREILVEMQPAFEDVFTIVIGEMIQKFLNRYPSNQIFID